MISSYEDRQPPGNNPSYYYRASPTLPQLLWMLPETPYVLYMQLYNIRVTHRNESIHIFYTNQIHGGIIKDCSLFILSLHALALHLAVKYYFKSFCMKIWARWPYIHLSVVFPPECQQDRTLKACATNTMAKTFLIFDINHQQNTRRSDQIETIKTIMQNYAPSYHMEGFTNGSGCHF